MVTKAVSPPTELLNELFQPDSASVVRKDGKVVTGLGIPKLEFFAKWPMSHRAYNGCHIAN